MCEPCQKSGTHFLNIGGWEAELNREIVSCCACVRALCMSNEFGDKSTYCPTKVDKQLGWVVRDPGFRPDLNNQPIK